MSRYLFRGSCAGSGVLINNCLLTSELKLALNGLRLPFIPHLKRREACTPRLNDVCHTHRVRWGKTPRRVKTPRHDISELKLFGGNFFCSNLHTMCGQHSGKNNVPAISRKRNIGKNVFFELFSVFGLPFQVAAILHIIMKLSIFDTIERS